MNPQSYIPYGSQRNWDLPEIYEKVWKFPPYFSFISNEGLKILGGIEIFLFPWPKIVWKTLCILQAPPPSKSILSMFQIILNKEKNSFCGGIFFFLENLEHF